MPAHHEFLFLDDSTGEPVEGAHITWMYGPHAARRWDSDRFGVATADLAGFDGVPAVRGRLPVRITAERYQWFDDTLDFDHLAPSRTVVRLRRAPVRYWLSEGYSRCPASAPPPAPVPFCALAVRPMVDVTAGVPPFGLVPVSRSGIPEPFVFAMVLDTVGRPIPETMKGMRWRTSAEDSIRSYLSRLHFTAARAAGERVETSLFVEMWPEKVEDDVPAAPFFRQQSFPRGIVITTGLRRIRPVQPPPVYSASTIRTMKRAVLGKLLPILEADSGRITCLAERTPDRTVNLDPVLVADLPADRYVPVSRCPRTYTTMFAQIDSLGHRILAPPGYHDPAYFEFEAVTPWTATVARLRVRTAVSSHGRLIQCVVYLNAQSQATRVTCGKGGSWVS